jgi:Mn-dependent DtxR family transcriptional regulator
MKERQAMNDYVTNLFGVLALAQKGCYNVRDIAGKMRLSERTVQRMIQRIERLGFAIDKKLGYYGEVFIDNTVVPEFIKPVITNLKEK